MGLKVEFDINKVLAEAKERLRENTEEKLITAFRLAFTDAVNYAKLNDRDGATERYTDRTGALNSSTGFQLYRDGELVHSYFQAEGGDGSGHSSGVSAGHRVAEEGARSMADKWICGVMVAGMYYAGYVEAKGYDVLTAAEFKLPEILRGKLEAVFGGSQDFKITHTDEF